MTDTTDNSISLADGDVEYYPNFLSSEIADHYFTKLRASLHWRQDKIKIFGTVHQVPRLQAWYGDENMKYQYSGIRLEPSPWTVELSELRQKLALTFDHSFNSVLANLYRTGSDSNGWHSDDERELGVNPVIASISLGQERFFHLKHKHDKSDRMKIVLEHGSLLVMSGATQHNYKHQIAKTKRLVGERINLTFRLIKKV